MSEAAVLEQQQALQAAICADVDATALLLTPSAIGLAVYRQAYSARLIAALRDNYLVLHRAMGDEQFDALGRAYLGAHPSSHASIRWFGDRLAEFMSGEFAEQLAHPALADFARMDWALRSAFDGADAPPLQAERLMALAPEAWADLVFHPQPTLQLQALDWAVEPAWRALRAHDPESGEPDPELDEPQPSVHLLLVWRQGLETRWRALEPLEAALLQALAAGQSFVNICALAAQTVGEERAAATVVQQLQGWLGDGLLAAA